MEASLSISAIHRISWVYFSRRCTTIPTGMTLTCVMRIFLFAHEWILCSGTCRKYATSESIEGPMKFWTCLWKLLIYFFKHVVGVHFEMYQRSYKTKMNASATAMSWQKQLLILWQTRQENMDPSTTGTPIPTPIEDSLNDPMICPGPKNFYNGPLLPATIYEYNADCAVISRGRRGRTCGLFPSFIMSWSWSWSLKS